MPTTDEEIDAVFKPSLTEDEIVAKLFGWTRGTIRKKRTHMTLQGFPEYELPYAVQLHGSVKDRLLQFREMARVEFLASVTAKDAHEVTIAKEDKVTHYDEQIKLAAAYLNEITHEIAKGPSSELLVDPYETDRTGVRHITQISADAWTRRKYGISIIDESWSGPGNIEGKSPGQASGVSVPLPRPEPPNVDAKTTASMKLTRLLTNNLYATFAFAVDQIATSALKYRHDDGTPKVSVIAERLSDLATEANNNEDLYGQSMEGIKDRIEAVDKHKIKESIKQQIAEIIESEIKEAVRIKNSKLPGGGK